MPFAPPFSIVLPGELLEESQMEASRLRQKAEELVKDNEQLPPPSPSLASFDHLPELTGPRGAWVVLCLPCAHDSLNPFLVQKSRSPSFTLGPHTILPVMFWLQCPPEGRIWIGLQNNLVQKWLVTQHS